MNTDFLPTDGSSRFGDLSSETLSTRIGHLFEREREHVVELLWHLAEFDRRELALANGYDSLYAWLTVHHRLSNASAYRRVIAARLLGRFPVIGDYLASGRLCLTTLCLLRDVLEEQTHVAVLEQAAGKTEDEVKRLVKTLCPETPPADVISRVPTQDALPQLSTSGPEVPPREPDRVHPVTAELSVLRITVGAEFLAELAQVKHAVSHKVPDGRLEDILRECFRVTLKACKRRRRGSDLGEPARAKPAAPRPGSRYIPAEVRRAVWERDGESCAFVGVTGKRCGSQHKLELDHEVAFARGGEASVSNLRVTCSAHNQHRARQTFGPERVEQRKKLRAAKRPPVDARWAEAAAGLRDLGASDKQAKEMLRRVEEQLGPEASVEEILRAALAMLRDSAWHR